VMGLAGSETAPLALSVKVSAHKPTPLRHYNGISFYP
jgi:hypothetical protein